MEENKTAATPVTPQKLLNIDEVSAYLGIPKSSLYTQICTKTFPPELVTRLGRRLRFDKERLDAWVEKQRGTPNA